MTMIPNLDDLLPISAASRLAGVTPQGGGKLFSRIGAVVVIGGVKFVPKDCAAAVKAAHAVLRQGRQSKK